MAINYPTGLDTLTNPAATDNTVDVSHAGQHSDANDILEALETKLGIDGSAVTTTHDYKLSGVTGSDKAVSKTGTETLTNKTLTAPTITSPTLTVGSDATGDIYYNGGSGVLTRLAVGTNDQILRLAGGVPTWDDETPLVDASTTVKGIVEEATLAEINANTAAGGTGARLFVNPSTLGKSIDGTMADNSDAKISSQKAIKTYVDTEVGAVDTLIDRDEFPNSIDEDSSLTIVVPINNDFWTHTGDDTTFYIEGGRNRNAGGGSIVTTNPISRINGDGLIEFGDKDMRVRFKGYLGATPVGTTPWSSGDIWGFVGFTETGLSGQTEGDITDTTARMGICYYDGKHYAVTANGSNVESTEIGSYTTNTMVDYIINRTGSTVTYYANGSLVATHSTYAPGSGTDVYFGSCSQSYAGTAIALYLSSLILTIAR